MKIAMVGLRSIGDASGGVERVVEELSAALAARDHDVTVFCRGRYNPSGRETYRGVKRVNVPAIYTKHLEAISYTLLSLIRCLRGFDVVHIHAVGPALLAWLPRMFGQRVVVTVHALDWKREKWGAFASCVLRLGERAAAYCPHKTIVVSRLLEKYYNEQYGKKTQYIPNGTTPSTARPVKALPRWNLKGHDYVLYLGRLVPEKGCHTLIEAFRTLDTEKKLLVVGEATHEEAYVKKLHALAGDDKRITFAGSLFGEEKEEVYCHASCLAFPSVVEGMPLVLMEALSLGCPIVCSDIPENMEIVRPAAGDELFAETCAAGSTDDLRAKLASALSNTQELKRRAERGRTYVTREFEWGRIAAQTEDVYQSVANGGVAE